MRLLHLGTSFPRATLLAVAAVTALATPWAIGLRIDSAVDHLLPRHDPARAYYEEVRTRFGSEEVTVIGVFAEDVFAPATLVKIDRLSTALAALDGVRDVLSLTTARGAVAAGGVLRSGRLLEAMPPTPAQADALRRHVRQTQLYRGTLLGRDDRSAGIVVFYEPMTDQDFLASDLEGRIRALLRDAGGPEEFALAGMPTLKAAAARLIEHDLLLFVPLSTLLVGLVLALAFRSLRGVVLPLGAVLVALVWTAGFMTAWGSAITFGTLIVPPLVIAVGAAYAIHVMNQYNRFTAPGRSPRVVTEKALDDVWVPLGVAGLTTMIGFVTFLVNPIPTIREFGLFASVGIGAVMLLSLTFIPAALTLLPVPSLRDGGQTAGGRVDRLLDRLGEIAAHRSRLVLIVCGVVAVVCAAGILQLRVETDYLGFFRQRGAVRSDDARVASGLAGTQPITIVVETQAKRGLLRPEVFAGVARFQRFLDAQPEIDTTLSVIDHLALVKRALLDDPNAPPPTSAAEATQLLMLIDTAKLSDVVTPDFERGTILVRTRNDGSAALRALVTRIEDAAGEYLPAGIATHVTGAAVLINQSADDIAAGQLRGLSQALAALLLVMSGLFLSVRIGAVSLVPNLFPIVVLFGVMGWTGISLNLATSLIATIAIGIAIDDTIHFLAFFNATVRRSADQARAAGATLRTIGPAMVITSVALALGFLVVAFSGFVPIRHFGLLASGTMVVALATDLFLTPALMQRVRLVTLWEVLQLRLGEHPERAIPMFAGLRPMQARIVVLMSRLATAEPGTLLTRRGDTGAQLFLLLSGHADVLAPDGRVVHHLGRGDVVGEMGALRHVPRSADVVVRDSVDYLVVDQPFLERLRRRYPRTAAVVFLNLARILSDRLEHTTAELAAVTRQAAPPARAPGHAMEA